MSWKPESKSWPDKHAVLFVHGVGNSNPGDYDSLIEEFRKQIGEDVASQLAIYFLYYDDLNDKHAKKNQLASTIDKLKKLIRDEVSEESGNELSEAIAEYAGDVIYPVLSKDARVNIRERFIAQLQQIRLDGKNSDVFFFEQRISIICHSVGCFHTYEALHSAVAHEKYQLRPVTDDMQFANVIYMASPVQLIRSIASRLGGAVPKRELASLRGEKLFVPSEKTADGITTFATKRWISITGNFDPIGGHLLGKRLDWAYMDVDMQESFIGDQAVLNISGKSDLARVILNGVDRNSPTLPLSNPHSWEGYIQRHKGELRKCLSV